MSVNAILDSNELERSTPTLGLYDIDADTDKMWAKSDKENKPRVTLEST